MGEIFALIKWNYFCLWLQGRQDFILSLLQENISFKRLRIILFNQYLCLRQIPSTVKSKCFQGEINIIYFRCLLFRLLSLKRINHIPEFFFHFLHTCSQKTINYKHLHATRWIPSQGAYLNVFPVFLMWACNKGNSGQINRFFFYLANTYLLVQYSYFILLITNRMLIFSCVLLILHTKLYSIIL